MRPKGLRRRVQTSGIGMQHGLAEPMRKTSKCLPPRQAGACLAVCGLCCGRNVKWVQRPPPTISAEILALPKPNLTP